MFNLFIESWFFHETHKKKLENLTENVSLPFTQNEVIQNFSDYELSDCEADILKYGLNHAIPPIEVNKTEVLASFEMLYRTMKVSIKKQTDEGRFKSELSYLANKYVSDYKPSKWTLKKHS